ncbi:MAG TPA: heme-binding domain-containing protein [Anaerolineales bacterium]
MNKWMRIILGGVGALVHLALPIQLIPYGHDHANPPVLQEPNWDSPETRATAKRACFDCHSNETVWPWYSNFAPVSWLIYHDVASGREHLNFSEWNIHPSMPAGEGEGEEHQHGPDVIKEVLESGEMPPAQYLLLHPEARLTDQELQIFTEGLIKSTQK